MPVMSPPATTPNGGWDPFAWGTDGMAFGVLTLQNAVDVMLTGVIALLGGLESFPLSAWALETMGVPGLVVVKLPFLILTAGIMLTFEQVQTLFRRRYSHITALPHVPTTAMLVPVILLYCYVDLNNIFVMFCIGKTKGLIP